MLVSTFYYKQMPVLYTCDKTHTIASELIIKILYKNIPLLCGKMSAMMILYHSILQTDDIATQGEISRLQLIADTCSLKRSATFIHLVLVITKDRAVCHLAARMESVGHGD